MFSIGFSRDFTWYFLAMFYLLAVLLGEVSFSLWGQVEYIYSTGTRLSEWVGHPHFTRYLLVYPVYVLAEYLKADPNYIFSILVSLLVVQMSRTLGGTVNLFVSFHKARSYSLLFLATLSLFMNGRIIFPLVAMSWLVFLMVQWWMGVRYSPLKNFLAILVIFWMSTVSSGTFSVIYMAVLYWLGEVIFSILKQNSLSVRNLSLLSGLLLSLGLLCVPFFVFLEKNLSYYGADIMNIVQLLQHGFGKVFFQFSLVVNVLLIGVLTMVSLVFIYVFFDHPRYRPLLVCLVIGAGGGAFGYSTLAMAIPPAIAITIVFAVNASCYAMAAAKRQRMTA